MEKEKGSLAPPHFTEYCLVALPVQSFVRYSSGVQVKTGSNCNET